MFAMIQAYQMQKKADTGCIQGGNWTYPVSTGVETGKVALCMENMKLLSSNLFVFVRGHSGKYTKQMIE